MITMFAVLALAILFAACEGGITVPSGEKTVEISSMDELEEVVMTDLENTVAGLETEYEKLAADINSYNKYISNIGMVEAYYATILEETQQLCIRMREYSISYVELALETGENFDDMEEMIDDMYDCIREDAGDIIYDKIYDGVLDKMYDTFYDGVVDDGYDEVPYDEWLDVSSDAYDIWLDTSSDVYDEWLDYISDVYDFWSDVNGAFWDNNEEEARETIDDFAADIESIKAEKII